MDEHALTYDGFDPDEEGLREALTSTGNGYFCTRGTAEWEDTDDVHYAGTYAHGLYNRETTIMGGRPVLNEDLVNLPNWLALKLRIEGEDAIRVGNVELLDYRHEYDVAVAMVSRELRFRDRGGRETTLRSRRFMSMAHSHQAAIEWTLTPENWSGCVEIVTALDGRVTNGGVERYGDLEGRHLNAVSPRTFGPEVIALHVETRQSNIYVAQAARTRVFRDAEQLDVKRDLFQAEDYIQQVLAFDMREGETVRVEKLVSLYTSRDRAIYEPLTNAGKSVGRYPDFAEALERHTRAWDELWRSGDVELPGNARVQHLLRLHISHVLQVCSSHTTNHDAGVPARGLNGEAYRGHVFWDELYVFRYLTSRLPEVTRELIMYRYRRLGEARAAACEAGYKGAMFPWQSGSDGSEETQVVHLNPLSGQWDPDLSHRQRHVNAAIFYNVWHYHQATGDLDFLRDHGAEIMLEIARFWSSIAHYNADRDRYEIHGVMGPDEFHEKYPGAEESGLRNNAYTNVMVAWICEQAQVVLDLLTERRRDTLRAKLGLADEEIETWQDMSRKMYVPFHGDGIISQFEGYDDLEELDWEGYRAKHDNIQRLDRILRAEGDEADRYKLAKQADTVLLFFLFSPEEISRLFERLDYEWGPDSAKRNIDYYDERTSHGSTLSYIAHAGVLAALDPEHSWERFLVALESDVGDVQGGTTKEGIHLGVMAGTIDLVQRAYTGAEIRDGVLFFAPTLTDKLNGLSFPMQVHGTPIRVTIGDGELTVVITGGFSRALKVGIGDDVRELGAGERCTFTLEGQAAAVGRASDTQGGNMTTQDGFRGAIFDVDGVLVDSPHEAAWRDAFQELMDGDWADIRDQTSWTPDAFTSRVYQEILSGKPRMAGAMAALEHFGVPDPQSRVEAYADRKQEMVIELIEAGEFSAYPDALRFVFAVKDAGLAIAAASSSKNAGLFLRKIRLDSFAEEEGLTPDWMTDGLTLLDAFDVDISGREFDEGKPHPEIFLTAASELGIEPAAAFVIEDAESGIQAAKAGEFAALGVARHDDEALLADADADVVVTSLDDISLEALAEGRLEARAS